MKSKTLQKPNNAIFQPWTILWFLPAAVAVDGKKVNEDKEIRFSTYVLILQNDETNLGGFGWVGAKDCRERQSARRLVT